MTRKTMFVIWCIMGFIALVTFIVAFMDGPLPLLRAAIIILILGGFTVVGLYEDTDWD